MTHRGRVYPAHTLGDKVQHGGPANDAKCVLMRVFVQLLSR